MKKKDKVCGYCGVKFKDRELYLKHWFHCSDENGESFAKKDIINKQKRVDKK